MAGKLHEAIVELFRNRPRLALELIARVAPASIPGASEARIESIESVDLGDAKPLERAADFVARFGPASKAVRVIVEVQLRRSREKRLSWPGYVAVSWARTGCPTYLVVVTVEERVARWAAEPIEVGQFVFRPTVVGPSSLPLILDAEDARRSPELAVLTIGVHPDHPKVATAAALALDAVSQLDELRAGFYTELVLAWLPEAARAILEANMDIKREFISEYTRRKLEQGRAEGRAESILRVLSARGIAVSDATAARIRACDDVARLDAWLERLPSVATAEELFG